MGMRYRCAIENHVRIHADRMRVKGWDPYLSANYAQSQAGRRVRIVCAGGCKTCGETGRGREVI